MKRKGTFFKQNGKTYVHLDDTNVYYKNLDSLYEYIKEGHNIQFLNFSFITLCSSTLEASLNHIIFHYYINKFGPIEYKKFTDSFINLSFKNKLYSTPNIVTKSKYHFNSESFTIKSLEKLISVRNKILHKKPFLTEFERDIDDLKEGENIDLKSNNYIEFITKKECDNFYKAINIFKNEFMNPFLENTLKETKLIIKD